MNVGAELKRARHLRGLSIEEVSNRARVSIQALSAIENNQDDASASAVDVRGALRAYAEEVQLDPDDVIQRYFAQFEAQPRVDVLDESKGSLDVFPSEATIAPRAVVAGSMASTAPATSAPARPASAPAIEEGFRIEHTDNTGRIHHREATGFHALLTAYNTQSEGADLQPVLTERVEDVSRGVHRYHAMAAVALIGAVAGFLLAEYSHRWRSVPPTPHVASIQGNTRQESNQRQNPATVPGTETKGDVMVPGSGGVATTSEPWRVPKTSVDSTSKGAAPPQPDAATVAKRSRSTDATPVARAGTVMKSSAQNLSGWWSVTNRVESTQYRPYEDLNLGYRLKLTHEGDQITGTGRKWMENGRQLPPAQRTAIAVTGTVEQRRVMLWFTEYGTRRTSVGSFAYDISDPGVLLGTFTSDAAQSKGSSRAARMPATR